MSNGAAQKYEQIKDGIYNDSSNPLGKYNFNFEQQAETKVGESLSNILPNDEDSFDKNDGVMAARLFIDGMWLNKGEEIASWISAAAYKTFGMYGSEDKTITQIRGEMLGRAEADQARFQQERPILATTSNIAGNIFSPASVYGGQVLTNAARVRQAAQARQASQAVNQAVGGAVTTAGQGGRQLAQQLSGFSPRAFNVIEKTPVAAMGAGLAATEGAVIGFEGENLEDKIENAGKTAALSALFAGGLSGTGYLINKAIVNNTAQQLGRKGNFVSLMFTDHMLAPVYTHLISKAYGAKSFMEQQARAVVSRMPSSEKLAQRKIDLEKNAETRLNQSQRILNQEKDEAIETARLLADDVKSDLTTKNQIAVDELDEISRARIDGLQETTTKNLDNIKANQVKEADAAVNALESSFRSDVYRSSMPSATPQALFDDLETLNPQESLTKIREAWRDYGFAKSKNATIRVSQPAIKKQINKIIASRPENAILEAGAVRTTKVIGDYIDEVLSTALDGASSGVVKASTLVDMRSSIGRVINGLSDDRFLTKQIIDPIQDYIDDKLILGRLRSKTAKNDFKADREIWRVKSTLEDAALNAVKRESAFGVEDWIGANAKQSGRLATAGQGILQGEAQRIRRLVNQRDEQITTLARNTANNIKKQTAKQIAEERSSLTRAKKGLAQTLNTQKKEATQAFQRSRKTAIDRARLNQQLKSAQETYKRNLSDIDADIAKLDKSKSVLAEIAPRSSMSLFEQLFATGIISSFTTAAGAGAAGVGGAGIGLIGAAGIARGLGSESAQRFLAGQTAAQQQLVKFSDQLSSATNFLANRYGITTPSVAASVSGQEQRPQMIFGEGSKKAIQNSSGAIKARIYKGLQDSDRLDILKAQDPKFFSELKSAFDFETNTQ